jgi:hypothetical protein
MPECECLNEFEWLLLLVAVSSRVRDIMSSYELAMVSVCECESLFWSTIILLLWMIVGLIEIVWVWVYECVFGLSEIPEVEIKN